MFNEEDKHESYGMLDFSRVQGGPTHLFGSSIAHSNTIRMRVSKGHVDRHLSQNWYHSGDEFIEIEMSYTQFTEAITNMNTRGVPVTILRVAGKQREACPFDDVKDKLKKEFQRHVAEMLGDAATAAKAAEEVLKRPGTLKKEERLAIASTLFKIEQDIRSNMQFVVSQFHRQSEKTVTEAKGEIEAFFSHKIHELGSEALVQQLERGDIRSPQIPDMPEVPDPPKKRKL